MGGFSAYFSDLRRDAGGRLWHAAALVMAGALLEGVGVLAILPFAALITGEAEHGAARWALDAMAAMGIASDSARGTALGVFFLALLALRGLVICYRDTTLYDLGLGYVDRWRSRLFAAIGTASWQAIVALRRTDIEHALNNDVGRLAAGTDRLLRTGASVALAMVQLGVLAAVAPLLLLVVIALMGLAAVLSLPLIRRAGAMGRELTNSGRRIHGVLGDYLASQKLARLNNADAAFRQRFEVSISDVRQVQKAFFASQARARGWFMFVAGAAVTGVLLVGLFALETPLPVLVVALVIMARLVSPVQMVSQSAQAIGHALPAFAALRTLETELLASRIVSHPAAVPSTCKHEGPISLELREVRFAHPGQTTPALDGASLRLGAGQCAVLSGGSGAGKTTLLDIATGLLAPDSGTVLLDGERMASTSCWQSWRDRIAYLPQDPFLFDASLRDNLLWQAGNGEDHALWQALELAGAVDFIRALPAGLDTRAGERGTALSGGERQRLCLARALLRAPGLLILDEATNALDADLEQRILERLRAMKDDLTLLVVTHRPDTIANADLRLALVNGKLVSK